MNSNFLSIGSKIPTPSTLCGANTTRPSRRCYSTAELPIAVNLAADVHRRGQSGSTWNPRRLSRMRVLANTTAILIRVAEDLGKYDCPVDVDNSAAMSTSDERVVRRIEHADGSAIMRSEHDP